LILIGELAINCQLEDRRVLKLLFSLDRRFTHRTMIPQQILQPRIYVSYNLLFFLATRTDSILSYAMFIPTHPISQQFSNSWISFLKTGTRSLLSILAQGILAWGSLHSLPSLWSSSQISQMLVIYETGGVGL
jgi:hypothetical protein